MASQVENVTLLHGLIQSKVCLSSKKSLECDLRYAELSLDQRLQSFKKLKINNKSRRVTQHPHPSPLGVLRHFHGVNLFCFLLVLYLLTSRVDLLLIILIFFQVLVIIYKLTNLFLRFPVSTILVERACPRK